MTGDGFSSGGISDRSSSEKKNQKCKQIGGAKRGVAFRLMGSRGGWPFCSIMVRDRLGTFLQARCKGGLQRGGKGEEKNTKKGWSGHSGSRQTGSLIPEQGGKVRKGSKRGGLDDYQPWSYPIQLSFWKKEKVSPGGLTKKWGRRGRRGEGIKAKHPLSEALLTYWGEILFLGLVGKG